jgi:hypothetical protein
MLGRLVVRSVLRNPVVAARAVQAPVFFRGNANSAGPSDWERGGNQVVDFDFSDFADINDGSFLSSKPRKQKGVDANRSKALLDDISNLQLPVEELVR